MPRAVDLRLVAERLIGCRNAGVLLKLVVLLVARPLGDGALGEAAKPISYSESGADGRIRTGDPLFTKQLLCQLSYVGVRTDYMRGLPPQRKGVLFTKWRPSCARAPGD